MRVCTETRVPYAKKAFLSLLFLDGSRELTLVGFDARRCFVLHRTHIYTSVFYCLLS